MSETRQVRPLSSESRSGDLANAVWSDPPLVHAEGTACFSLSLSALRWLQRELQPGMTTLETGSGASTVLFASSGASHTTISPEGHEHDRIREYCDARGVSHAHVSFVVSASHEVLPAVRPGVDLVLLDGAHGFPYPILDWALVHEKLSVGGRFVVDDAFLSGVQPVVAHMRASSAWRQTDILGDRTVVFEKVADSRPPFHDWSAGGARYDFRYLPIGRRLVASTTHGLAKRSRRLRALRKIVGRQRRALARR